MRRPPHPVRYSRRPQSGVVLLVTLLALVIILIGALAIARSADTSSVIAGNVAFKRDLTNNAERGAAAAIAEFASGGVLYTATTAYSSLKSANYSATTLPSSAGNKGMPDALLDDSKFTTYGVTTNDIVDAGSNITIRYLIDRMCTQTGAPSPTTCVVKQSAADNSGASWEVKAGGGYQAVYRISIRVSGPRNTQAFVQTTLAN